MPVTEKLAEEVILTLPENSWLRTYIVHAMRQTTSPLVYHLGVGLAVLAASCPTDFGMNYAGLMRQNLFVLLVGRSGEDQKSTAVSIGREILYNADDSRIGEYPGSAEGLVESVASQAVQLIPMSEFGKFLSAAQSGYFEKVKTVLNELWDCEPQTRKKASQKGATATIRADNPRLSVCAACSIPYLETYTLSSDWTGGFMGRWLVFYGERERNDPDPVGDRRLFDGLVHDLRSRVELTASGWCDGLDAEAKETWDAWYYEVSNRHLPSHILGIRARAPAMARRVALLLGWDYGGATAGRSWKISRPIILSAIYITELHIQSLAELSGVIADHPDARRRRSVIDAIKAHGGAATLGQLLDYLKTTKRPVVEMLEALLESGRIRKIRVGDGLAFELVAGGEATAS